MMYHVHIELNSFITNLVYIDNYDMLYQVLFKLMQASAEVFMLKEHDLVISKTSRNSDNINCVALK